MPQGKLGKKMLQVGDKYNLPVLLSLKGILNV